MLGLAASSPATAEDIRDGEQFFNSGDYAACITLARDEIDGGNYLEQWRVLKIKCELATGAYEDALATVDTALEDFPTSLALRLLGHSVYRLNGQSARAATELEMIEQLATSEPRRYSSPASRVALGRYFLQGGADARQVLEIFYDPVVATWPDFIEGHLASAELSLAKYDNALAAEVLTKAPEAAKESPDYHYLLARAYAEDDAPAAEAEIDAALAINPRHARTLLLKADGLIDAEEYDAAEAVLELVAEVNRREPLAWAYKAVLANLKGDAKTEEAARNRALADWQENPEVDHTIGRKLSRQVPVCRGGGLSAASVADRSQLPAGRDATFAGPAAAGRGRRGLAAGDERVRRRRLQRGGAQPGDAARRGAEVSSAGERLVPRADGSARGGALRRARAAALG